MLSVFVQMFQFFKRLSHDFVYKQLHMLEVRIRVYFHFVLCF